MTLWNMHRIWYIDIPLLHVKFQCSSQEESTLIHSRKNIDDHQLNYACIRNISMPSSLIAADSLS